MAIDPGLGPEDEELTFGQRVPRWLGNHWQGLLTTMFPIFCLPLLFLTPVMAFRCMYVVIVMSVFWVTEAIPLYVTSMIPIIALPVMGVLSSEEVCSSYFANTVILFFGGLVIALAIEYSNLHSRIALSVILLVGTSPRRLHLSLCMVTMFISMWISNSAATAMMCPILKAVLTELSNAGMAELYNKDKSIENEPPYPSALTNCFYLGAAYSATFGGCGSLIGTGTNVTFKGLLEGRFPDGDTNLNFLNFMVFNIPPMLILTTLNYFWLQILYLGMFRPNSAGAKEIEESSKPEGIAVATNVIKEKYAMLGPWTCHEVQVGIIFVLMVALLITQKPGVFPGWVQVLKMESTVKSAIPMVFCVLLLFYFPTKFICAQYCFCQRPNPEGPLPSLITWKYVNQEMPFGLLFLLGGGFALANGIQKSGLATMLANALKVMETLPAPIIQLCSIIAGLVLTAFAANVAACNIVIPVLLEMAIVVKIHPMYLGLPTTMAISCAFHFPVSTPPNAIISGFANIRTKDMAIAGIGPSICSIVVYFIAGQFLGPLVFDGFNKFPEWADVKPKSLLI